MNESTTANQIIKTFSYTSGTIAQIDTLLIDATINYQGTDIIKISATECLFSYKETTASGSAVVASVSYDGSFDLTDNNNDYGTAAIATWSRLFKHDDLIALNIYDANVNFVVRTLSLGAQGWSHTLDGVSSPTAINAVTDWTIIDGVE